MTLAATLAQSRRDREAWKYCDTKRLDPLAAAGAPPRLGAESLVLPAPIAPQRLVFLNGRWDESASRRGALPFDLLRGDPVRGYTLTLAEQTCLVVSPLELLFLNAPGTAPAEITTRLRVNLGASARLTLVETHQTPGSGRDEIALAHVLETHVDLGPQAKLVHGRIVTGNAATAQLAHTTVKAAEGAFYDRFTLVRGGALTRDSTDVALAGERAHCALNGVLLLRDRDHADIATRVTHAAPGATSRQNWRSVLDGKARGAFTGRVVVDKGAWKTDASQTSHALLLSEQADMAARPELTISADDVLCKHGSSVGALDDEALFYLRARGLPEAEARAMLMVAFVRAVTESIATAEIRDAAIRETESWVRP